MSGEGYVCQHCGVGTPFRWMGGFHCREQGEPFTYGALMWQQGERDGRWPKDWPWLNSTVPD